MQRWSMGFVGDQLADCRRFRVLNIVDGETLFAIGSRTTAERRFCPGQSVDVSVPGARVARVFDDLAVRFGLPEEIILDTGPEGTSTAVFDWSERSGLRLRFIEPPLGEYMQSPAGNGTNRSRTPSSRASAVKSATTA